MTVRRFALAAALLAGAGAFVVLVIATLTRYLVPPATRPTVAQDQVPGRAPAAIEVVPAAPAAPLSPSGRLSPAAQGATPATAAPVPQRLSIELATPARLRGGAELAVEVRLRGEVAGRGWLDLGFDPAVLTLADASVRYESREAGVVRLYFEALAPQARASLQFAASFDASAPTVVRVVGGEFVSTSGRTIGVVLPPAAGIVIERPTAAGLPGQ